MKIILGERETETVSGVRKEPFQEKVWQFEEIEQLLEWGSGVNNTREHGAFAKQGVKAAGCELEEGSGSGTRWPE